MVPTVMAVVIVPMRYSMPRIQAFPRALAAVEDAEAASRGRQVAAHPSGRLGVADLAPQHPLSPRVQVSAEVPSDPAANTGNDDDGVQHDVAPHAVTDAIAERHDEIPPDGISPGALGSFLLGEQTSLRRRPSASATGASATAPVMLVSQPEHVQEPGEGAGALDPPAPQIGPSDGTVSMEAAIPSLTAFNTPAAPAVPHRGGDAHAGHQDVERQPVMVPRAKIGMGQSTQARVGINAEVVETYAEALRAGESLPPPELVRDDDDDCFWTADGHHRILAHDKLHDNLAYEIEAMVQLGTRRDAVLLAVAANRDHGLQRTNADKRRAVTLLLEDAEWREWSDRGIARRCNVGHSLVAEVRHHLFGQAEDAETRRFVTKHGTESKMRLKGGQRAAGDAHHAGAEPARLEPAAGKVGTGNGESVPGSSGNRSDASTYSSASGDPAKTSLAAAASEPGGGRPAAAEGGQLGVVAGRGHVRPSRVPTEVKPVVPTGVVVSAGMDATAAREATTLLDEMKRVHVMFVEATRALEGLGTRISSVEGLTRRDMARHYLAAHRMGSQMMTHLRACEAVLAGSTPGTHAAPAGMGRPPAKSKPARSNSEPTAKTLPAAKAVRTATAKPSKATKPSLAKTSPKSPVESKPKPIKKGRTRR